VKDAVATRPLKAMSSSKKTIDFDVVRKIALALPDVEESTIHGAPSLKLRGKLLACPAIHRSAEPNTLAVRIDFDQRARLIADAPSVYYVTDHYVNYPTVLVRLSQVDRNSLRDLLDRAWRFVGSQTKPTGRRGRSQGRSP
jgi:hypothetical protein